MLYIGFSINNPWCRRHQLVKDTIIRVSKNKTLEVGLYKTNAIVGASLGIRVGKRDHTGFSFDADLLGWTLDVEFYDNRHYDERTQN